jgi:LPS-assembly protein
MIRALLISLTALLSATGTTAQDAATLIADSLRINGNDQLIAEGNVEVLFGDTQLTATRVTYSGSSDQISIDGPVRLRDGDTLLEADAAQIDEDLQNGLLIGARLILNQQVQIAAAQLTRVEGRYTQLHRTVATSCQVCEETKTPLWSIRARRVVHDEQEQQLYFDEAQLRILDVPVLYLPRLRLPDPTLTRSTGFLIPQIKTTSQLGTGVKFPYFITLGDHADLTLTPYVSNATRTLEFRYRQAFTNGDIDIQGAFTGDDIRSENARAYLFADGQFDLNRGYKLSFDIEATGDNTYLLDYDYASKDRLDSQVSLTRTRAGTHFSADLIHFETLRDSEDNSTLPPIVGDVIYERHIAPGFGGTLSLRGDAHTHFRYSDLDGFGRDVTRLSGSADWRRNWILGNGMQIGALGAIYADLHLVEQDQAYDSATAQITPYAGVELRWPFAKTTQTGVTHLLEPVVQAVWSDTAGEDVPNEDSTRVEFDEGNLFAFSRFPGSDLREGGARLNLGVSWSRFDQAGTSSTLSFGKIYRDRVIDDFSLSSGLSKASSDWLISGSFALPNGLELISRTLLNDGLKATKSETRIDWTNDIIDLGATYTWLTEDAGEDRLDSVSEWSLDSKFQVARHWATSLDWRYDVVTSRTAQAGFGIEYRNECVEIDLSLSRRFTSSSNLEPSTDFGFSVSLSGFSTGGRSQSYARSCSG